MALIVFYGTSKFLQNTLLYINFNIKIGKYFT